MGPFQCSISTDQDVRKSDLFLQTLVLSSSPLPLISSVLVSKPEISVVGQVILGQPVKILCHSHTGSLPINYTLKKGNTIVGKIIVRLHSERAIFTVHNTSDLGGYKCDAINCARTRPLQSNNPSTMQTATVIGRYLNLTLLRLFLFVL